MQTVTCEANCAENKCIEKQTAWDAQKKNSIENLYWLKAALLLEVNEPLMSLSHPFLILAHEEQAKKRCKKASDTATLSLPILDLTEAMDGDFITFTGEIIVRREHR